MTTDLDHRTPNETAAMIGAALILLAALPAIICMLILFRLCEAWVDSRACKGFLSWWFGDDRNQGARAVAVAPSGHPGFAGDAASLETRVTDDTRGDLTGAVIP